MGVPEPHDESPEPAATNSAFTLRSRLGRVDALFNRGAASPQSRQRLLVASFALFVGVCVTSWLALPDSLEISWWPIPVLLLATTPATLFVNAAEYRIMTRMNGRLVEWQAAFRLTVMASAANLLPLPGGVVIRTQALHSRGASYKRAIAANAAAGLTWIACGSFLIAILAAATGKSPAAAGCLAVVGVASASSVIVILRRFDSSTMWGHLGRFAVVESAMVAINAIRILLAFELIGLSATVVQATALTSAQIVASAIGVFPAGLGVRELLAGAVGLVVSLNPAEAVTAIAADRVVGTSGAALLAAALVVAGRRGQRTDA